MPKRKDMCSKCMNQFTQKGNPECSHWAKQKVEVPPEEEPLPIPPSPHTRWWPDEPDAA